LSAKDAKIFLSYSRADSDFALKLGKDLRSAGANIWIDQLDMATGMDWDDAIEEALGSCQSFLVILSPAAKNSRNVKNEIALSIQEDKNIIPVLHVSCKIPLNLIRKNWIDFTAGYESGLKRLLNALNIQPPIERIEQAKPKEEKRKQPEEVEANDEPLKKTIKAKIDRKPKRLSVYLSKHPLVTVSIILAVLGGYFIILPMFDSKPPAETADPFKDMIPPTDSLTALNQKESGTTKDRPGPKKTINASSSDRKNKETIQKFTEPTPTKTSDIKPETTRPAVKYQLRSSPELLSRTDVQSMRNKYDFYDKTYHATGKGIANDFQRKGQVVYDGATGLTWQQLGSPEEMTFKESHKYIQELRDKKYASFSDWRLPTLEEAMSLMEPTENKDGLYINPIFDSRQPWIWTSDDETVFSKEEFPWGTWLVQFQWGSCYPYQFDCPHDFYVRAVR